MTHVHALIAVLVLSSAAGWIAGGLAGRPLKRWLTRKGVGCPDCDMDGSTCDNRWHARNRPSEQ